MRATFSLLLAILAGALLPGAAYGAASTGFDFPLGNPDSPNSYPISQGWCENNHLAIDWAAPGGTPVFASSRGTAVVSGWSNSYGYWVILRHDLPNGEVWRTLYAHFASPPFVGVGAVVERRQQIGVVGSTGNSTGNHLHFAVTSSSGIPRGYGPCGADGTVNPIAFIQSHRSFGFPDGSLVRTPDGRVFRIVGGAPIWISRCDYTNGCAGVVNVSDLAPFRAYPHDGALMANVDDGGIYRFAGGAPLWISSCGYLPGCNGVVQVDGYSMAVNDHMRPFPADGTLVSNHSDGGIYRFAGGAPLWLSSCAYPPGCAGVVTVDGGTFLRDGSISGAKRMQAVPADGTYLRIGGSETFMRVAGGAALRLSDCTVLDGKCEGAVAIDNGTLERLGSISGASRLLRLPRDGTVLHGRPSDQRWQLTGGVRVPSVEGGTQVNDSTVFLFPTPAATATPRLSSCFGAKKRLKHMRNLLRKAKKRMAKARSRSARKAARALVGKRKKQLRKFGRSTQISCPGTR
ncbi:MAG TPA: M23 family metallopeptidase [Solirubrobacterales bacterium]|nr:M23 family metallopeptidase [Solirubrobacterales bacterium]